jgi:hypothetical protein
VGIGKGSCRSYCTPRAIFSSGQFLFIFSDLRIGRQNFGNAVIQTGIRFGIASSKLKLDFRKSPASFGCYQSLEGETGEKNQDGVQDFAMKQRER